MNTIAVIFTAYSVQFGLPEGLLSALCYVESNHNPAAIHHDDGGGDSLGICQVKYKTAKWLGFKGTPEQLLRPEINIKYAAAYLKYQHKRYDNSLQKAVVAYNKGHADDVTSTYSKKVFKQWRKKDERKSKSSDRCKVRPRKGGHEPTKQYCPGKSSASNDVWEEEILRAQLARRLQLESSISCCGETLVCVHRRRRQRS